MAKMCDQVEFRDAKNFATPRISRRDAKNFATPRIMSDGVDNRQGASPLSARINSHSIIFGHGNALIFNRKFFLLTV
jgi:hypothetical protein